MVQIVELEENPDYLLYSDGRMWSKKYKKFLKPQLIRRSQNMRYVWGRGGYPAYNINRKIMKIHRALAKYFVHNPNPEAFKCVLHYDDNPMNWQLSNICWGDLKMNMQMWAANRKKNAV